VTDLRPTVMKMMALAIAVAATLVPMVAMAPGSAPTPPAGPAPAENARVFIPPASDWSPGTVPLRDSFVGPRLHIESSTPRGWGFAATVDGRAIGAPAPFGVDPNARFNAVDIGYGWRAGNLTAVVGYEARDNAAAGSGPHPQVVGHAGLTLTLHPR